MKRLHHAFRAAVHACRKRKAKHNQEMGRVYVKEWDAGINANKVQISLRNPLGVFVAERQLPSAEAHVEREQPNYTHLCGAEDGKAAVKSSSPSSKKSAASIFWTMHAQNGAQSYVGIPLSTPTKNDDKRRGRRARLMGCCFQIIGQAQQNLFGANNINNAQP
jgi:hypothetical protein